MNNQKGVLQKTAVVSAVISFILAFACAVVLIFWGEDIDYASPVFASVLATFFFLVFVGVVLMAIWKADLPNLKISNFKENKN